MPKLPCPCGFVHNLSGIPDDGWRAIRDADMEAYEQHVRNYAAGNNAPEGTSEKKAADTGWSEMLRMTALLYECPQCGRIRWRKARDENYHTYLPEDEATRVEALALAVAANYQQEQEAVRIEAIRIHNEAASIVAQRMVSAGLRCPHCFTFSKAFQFTDRAPATWSYFQCPSCARTFRLEKFRPESTGQAGDNLHAS